MHHEPSAPHRVLNFPPHFLWGSATAAHQVEGDNSKNDWWTWEKSEMRQEALRREGKTLDEFVSGDACDHYHRFEEDCDLIQQGGQNAHRLSIEWARIEPEMGEWDRNEIDHYRNVLQALRNRGVKTFVTLWHFTNPQWFSTQGGWLKGKNIKYFTRYCEYAAQELGDLVDTWVTINEPNVYAQMSFNWGAWPPQHRSYQQSLIVFWHLARAHARAYTILHRITPDIPVGIALNIVSYVAHNPHKFSMHFSAWLMHMMTSHLFYFLTGRSTHDYLGINYYFRTRIKSLSWTLSPSFVDVQAHGRETSSVGWEIYPMGLFESLADLARYHKPFYILENGIATNDEHQRLRFLTGHLREVYHALREGLDVRGYFYWSLIDNFEWQSGWGPKFGLIAVDRKTFVRTPKTTYYAYQKIAHNNTIPDLPNTHSDHA